MTAVGSSIWQRGLSLKIGFVVDVQDGQDDQGERRLEEEGQARVHPAEAAEEVQTPGETKKAKL